MASCLAARTAKSRSNEPPPCFAWGDPPARSPHHVVNTLGAEPKDGCAAALAPVPHPIASYRYPVLKPLVNLVPTNIVLTWYRLSLLHAVL